MQLIKNSLFGVFFLFLSTASYSSSLNKINDFIYDVIFLNDLYYTSEAASLCEKRKGSLSNKEIYVCSVFEKLRDRKVSIFYSKGEKQKTTKAEYANFSDINGEDFSLHYVEVVTSLNQAFYASINTSSVTSFADITPNLDDSGFLTEGEKGNRTEIGLAVVDIETDISGMKNKIFLTTNDEIGTLGMDFIGHFERVAFYPDGIVIKPSDLSCSSKCNSYNLEFDGRNLHFLYPLNGRLQRMSFETGSPISTVPFSVEDNCVAKDVDFSGLAERGLDISDKSKLCKWSYEFGDYTTQSSVVTQASRKIDGEPLPVMGMNMINAFDHVTLDLPAGKIYFYHH